MFTGVTLSAVLVLNWTKVQWIVRPPVDQQLKTPDTAAYKPIYLSSSLLACSSSLTPLSSTSSTEEPLFDPPWTVPQFFFLTLRLHGNSVPVTNSLDFCPSCSQNKSKKLWREGGEKEAGGGGQRNCVRDEGYGGMSEGIMGRCLGWRLRGETSSAVCVPESHKERRVMTRVVDYGQCQGLSVSLSVCICVSEWLLSLSLWQCVDGRQGVTVTVARLPFASIFSVWQPMLYF